MPESRWGRLCFTLIIMAALSVIGRNLYQRHQRASLFRAAEKGDTARLQSLLHQEVDVNAVNRHESSTRGKVQESPLLLATRAKKWDAARILLQAGADANFRDGGESPLHYAVEAKNVDAVQELLRHKANPNTIDMSGNPVIFSALAPSDFPIMQALVEANADLKRPDVDGQYILLNADSIGFPGSDSPKILRLIQLLVEHGADVNARGLHNGYTPLLAAVSRNDRDIVQFLLTHGASPTIKWLPKYPAQTPEQTPIALARQNKRYEIVELLRQAGAKQ